MDGGTLNIKGSTSIKSAGAPIYSSGTADNTVNIESGTLESTDWQAIEMCNSTGNINIGKKDGIVNKETPILKSAVKQFNTRSYRMHMNFYDGQLIGGHGNIIGVSINELEEGYQLVENEYEEDNQYKSMSLDQISSVAEIQGDSESNKTYDTLEEAVNSCPNVETQTTIKLLKTIYQTEQIIIPKDKNIKLDLNGQELFALTDNTIRNEGKLEIVDSTKSAEDENPTERTYNLLGTTGGTVIQNALLENEEGTKEKAVLTIGKGIKIYYTASGLNYNEYKYPIQNQGTLKTNDAILKATGGYVYVINNTGTFELERGAIETSGNYAYGIYGNSTEASTINGTNITLTGNNSYGIYNDNEGTITINENTTITTQASSVYNNKTGKIVMNGGTLSSKSNTIDNRSTGTIELNSGDIKSESSSNSSGGIYNNSGGTININNGSITCNYSGICNNR